MHRYIIGWVTAFIIGCIIVAILEVMYMEVKYVSPHGEIIGKGEITGKIEGFKLDQHAGSKVTCAECGTVFDTSIWTPGLLKIENKETGKVYRFLLCRDCSLRRMRHIEERYSDD